ncbi:NAD(P)H-hydrate dehydratase [Desulfoluna sp.]|uniref:NAD(P)H-hydrate dehydratase n=1 Tax=Desulfoluna sp. TaxID=2045199 RepID=UPI0026171C7D|nr:NAD(P)H-hydrate dehydratase [Desulfoluna sp.]
MLAVIGTVPDPSFPLVAGQVALHGEEIVIQGLRVRINRGTPALLASAAKICEALNLPAPFAYLAGDKGMGDGSKALYAHLEKDLKDRAFKSLVFHYLQPDVDWHDRVLFAIDEMSPRPLLIADAGFMYAAKMSGQALQYDLFTPDVGELAFLADELAPHPFYTRGFILHDDRRVPDLIQRAYVHDNAAKHLLVKGAEDYIVKMGETIKTVAAPSSPAMEAIGGTGDMVTGIVSALAASGMDLTDACVAAAKISRGAGQRANPSPATQALDIIEHITEALGETFSQKQSKKSISSAI